MDVIKKSGKKQKLNKDKIIKSCMRVGVSKKVCFQIADRILQECYDGISTDEIRLMVIGELSRRKEKSAKTYRNHIKDK